MINIVSTKGIKHAAVGGDTLTWDGNTEGLLAVGHMYKVSDVVLTDEQIKSSMIVMGDNTMNVSDSWDVLVELGAITPEIVHLEAVAIVRKPNATALGYSYPECGIYFFIYGTEYVNSLTIPGYDGFTGGQAEPQALPISRNAHICRVKVNGRRGRR